MTARCYVSGCVGPPGHGPHANVCDRHRLEPDAPPMKVTCECARPDVERLVYGGAQCRKCGSPIEGTLCRS